MDREKEFRKRLLATFKAEAIEHVATMSSGLTELERMPPIEVQMDIVETVFREAHSLKGAARAVNIPGVESLCQALESVFAQWKMRRIHQSRELYDTLHLAIDMVRAAVASTAAESDDVPQAQLAGLVVELERLATGGPAVAAFEAGSAKEARGAPVEPPASGPRPEQDRARRPGSAVIYAETSGTVRVSAGRLSSLLSEAEEMLPLKSEAASLSLGAHELVSAIEALRSELGGPSRAGAPAAVQETFARLDRKVAALEAAAKASSRSARNHSRALGRMIDSLLEDTKKTMLLPFSSLLEAFPMAVRDISRKKAKEAEIVFEGESLEIDRRILDELKVPLLHLVSNSVDHGIERPSERESAGKPRKGRIKISMVHADGNTAEIRVVDDGGGIDIERVKASAVKNGVIKASDAASLGGQEALSLIFHSGLTTSPIITDISGRGLGLAIVREKVERLGGSISVEASKAGTSFRILVPLTIATFRGVLVSSGGQSFIVPTSSIERTFRAGKSQFGVAENRETIKLGGEVFSFARLSSVLGLSDRSSGDGPAPVLLLASAGTKIAFGVDEITGEEDVLVKGLGPQLKKVRNISGAAILGTGRPVPIINVPDLLRSAVKTVPGPAKKAAPRASAQKRPVLVAEDSITSRMLLKNILETAGYEVSTAVDGVEAWTLMKTEKFDILVTDVEMPRMDGFELTARVRADKDLSRLPVVLVTALENREDRERGIEAGANAYMVKSSFNQNNLLEIVKRLTA